ncbi:MAG TPA: TetR/AcrR family transcriptional regulator [Ktedonobacterales bacterium]
MRQTAQSAGDESNGAHEVDGAVTSPQTVPSEEQRVTGAASIPDLLDLRELERTLAPAIEPFPRTPRQARSLRTRDSLLRAAAELFVARGYAGVTADEIAAAAGVSVGAFYNYYRNKRQILMALAQKRLGDIFSHLRLARMDLAHGDHHEVIRAVIASVIASDRSPGLRGVWQQLMSLEPELAPYQTAIRAYARDQLARQLQSAREAGRLWPDLDIEATSLAIFAMLDTLSARRDDDLPEERLIESVTAIIERALFPPTASNPAPRDGASS